MSIEKTLLIYRVCITKRPKEIFLVISKIWSSKIRWRQALDRFLKKKWHSRLFECLQFQESADSGQSRKCNYFVALYIRLKIISFPHRCKDIILLFRPNPSETLLMFNKTLDLFINIAIAISPSHYWIYFFKATIFTEICRFANWKRTTSP